jgi:hypothetical protein
MDDTEDPETKREERFREWIREQKRISDTDADKALTGDPDGNPLFKRLSSRPFRPQDDKASLERFRRWHTHFLEYFLEKCRHKLYAVQQNYSNLDLQFRPDVGLGRSLERTIRLIEQVLDERESRQRKGVAQADARNEIQHRVPEALSEAPQPKKRGRKSRFTEDQLRSALVAKKSGRLNSEVAKILYDTNAPTPAQRRSVPTILKTHFSKPAPPSKK